MRCRDGPAASPPLAPTPGAGAAQLRAETCLSNYRGDETFRGFTFLPGHTWETTFPISQFLRNNFPPAQPSLGSPVGSGGSRQPHLGLVVGAADSPVPPPAAPRAPAGSRGGWCLRSLCCVQGSSVSQHSWGLTACPRGVLVTGSWGFCMGLPKRLETHEGPARPFTFVSAGNGDYSGWDLDSGQL